MEDGMACEHAASQQWNGRIDAYLDGEVETKEAGVVAAHLRECAACAADALGRVQMKRSVQLAGKRYTGSAALRDRIAMSVASKPKKDGGWVWKLLAVPALSLLVLSVAVSLYVSREGGRRQRVYSELGDLHVSALASTTPVDVISTDRHTVKPWFQGKIPFSFNLPELQGTDFTLLGGRVTYLAQTPGAHLIYQVRKHDISVFIFQDRGEETASLASGPVHAMSFNVENWTQDGLRYFVVGDISTDDIQALSKLLREAR
jgi:anti-sigma factor RsiW